MKMRKSIATDIKNNFPDNHHCLVVHWDGKLLTSLGASKKERLPIIVSGVNIEQLLSVPMLDKSTGANQAKIIYQVLKEWNHVDQVKAMCFDTTAVNSGKILIYFIMFDRFWIRIIWLLLWL